MSKKQNPVSQRLIKGLSEEDAEEFARSYLRAKRVLQKINEYASKEVAQKSIQLDSPKLFETEGAYPYYQAWLAGYRYAMRITQDLTRT